MWENAYNMLLLFMGDQAPSFSTEVRSIYDPNAHQDNPVLIREETGAPGDDAQGAALSVPAEQYDEVSVEDVELDESREEGLIRRYVRFEPEQSEDPQDEDAQNEDALNENPRNEDAQSQGVTWIYVDESEDAKSDVPAGYFIVREEDVDPATGARVVSGAETAGSAEDVKPIKRNVVYVYENTPDGEGSDAQDEEPVFRHVLSDNESAQPENGDIYLLEEENGSGSAREVAYVVTGSGDAASDEQTGPQSSSYKYVSVTPNSGSTHKYIHIDDIEYPDAGDHYADLICSRIDLKAPVYWHDTNDIMRFGAGQYIGSFPPGFNRMILLSAHNNTYFEPLKDIQKGDLLKFNTNYCAYRYKVTDVQILNEKELEKYILEHILDEEEQLILYTCYPFEATVGRKTDRLTVFAKRIKGYDVKWRFDNE